MWKSLPRRWRHVISSLAYTALVALAAGLGYLTFRATTHRNGPQPGSEPSESITLPLIDVSAFSARREKSSDAERLNVSLRLRLTTGTPVDCYVYILARNEHVSPKLWVVWPTPAIRAVTAGGHFRGGIPPTGEPVQLTSSWTRISATLEHPPGQPPFDTVTLYVLNARGEVLLERPFAL
jgi:hypothetical protein